jgi:hypothetical protein
MVFVRGLHQQRQPWTFDAHFQELSTLLSRGRCCDHEIPCEVESLFNEG